jgi:hypothetical protein
MLSNRFRIIGAAVLVAATTLLPWFREQRPKAAPITLNAWQANALWPTLVLFALGVFVGAALFGLASDIRWLSVAFAAGLVAFVLMMAQCWISHRSSVPNTNVTRRWGLFVALNAAFALGAILKSVGDRVVAGWLDRNDVPLATGYEIG